ncbi:hypothetical protein BDP67DRAFT_495872 [Colletotrichum lupini]|nr:hypothetical protein BDP67DRAFT_495872 [Colletotrichum lupini]
MGSWAPWSEAGAVAATLGGGISAGAGRISSPYNKTRRGIIRTHIFTTDFRSEVDVSIRQAFCRVAAPDFLAQPPVDRLHVEPQSVRFVATTEPAPLEAASCSSTTTDKTKDCMASRF